MKQFKSLELLSSPGKEDGSAGNSTYRQGSTTAGITVQLGQNDAGQLQAFMETLRHIDRILACHGIGNQNDIVRLSNCLEPSQFFHQLVVDLQTATGIDQQRIAA